MNYSVRVIHKEPRDLNRLVKGAMPNIVWITEEIFHEIVEAVSKKNARKKVRSIYPNLQQYRLGRACKTERSVGKHEIPFKTIGGKND